MKISFVKSNQFYKLSSSERTYKLTLGSKESENENFEKRYSAKKFCFHCHYPLTITHLLLERLLCSHLRFSLPPSITFRTFFPSTPLLTFSQLFLFDSSLIQHHLYDDNYVQLLFPIMFSLHFLVICKILM